MGWLQKLCKAHDSDAVRWTACQMDGMAWSPAAAIYKSFLFWLFQKFRAASDSLTRSHPLTPNSCDELEVGAGPASWNCIEKAHSEIPSFSPQSLFPTMVNSPRSSADKIVLRF